MERLCTQRVHGWSYIACPRHTHAKLPTAGWQLDMYRWTQLSARWRRGTAISIHSCPRMTQSNTTYSQHTHYDTPLDGSLANSAAVDCALHATPSPRTRLACTRAALTRSIRSCSHCLRSERALSSLSVLVLIASSLPCCTVADDAVEQVRADTVRVAPSAARADGVVQLAQQLLRALALPARRRYGWAGRAL